MSSTKQTLLVFVGLFAFVGVLAYMARNDAPRDEIAIAPASAPAAAPAQPRVDPNACDVSKIDIVSTEGGFVDECRRTPCLAFKGVGVLRNRCTIPVGVQLKITGLDASGRPTSTRELWPASIRNIPPGEYTFSMDTWLDYDPRMETFRVEPVDTNQFR